MKTFTTKTGVVFSFATTAQDETLISITDRNNHRVEIGLQDFLEFAETHLKGKAMEVAESMLKDVIKRNIEGFSLSKLLKLPEKKTTPVD